MTHKRNVLNAQIPTDKKAILSPTTGMSHYSFKNDRKKSAVNADCSPNIRLSAHFKESILTVN